MAVGDTGKYQVMSAFARISDFPQYLYEASPRQRHSSLPLLFHQGAPESLISAHTSWGLLMQVGLRSGQVWTILRFIVLNPGARPGNTSLARPMTIIGAKRGLRPRPGNSVRLPYSRLMVLPRRPVAAKLLARCDVNSLPLVVPRAVRSRDIVRMFSCLMP